jgi:hypothetical protein
VNLRALLLAAVLALGAVAGAIVAGGTASAQGGSGTYTINACSPSTTSGGWTSVDQLSTSMTAGNLCGNGTPAIGPNNTISDTGALYGEDLIGSTTQVPNGDQAGWQLTAPTGVTITGISYYGSFETDDGGWLAGLLIDGQPLANVCVTGLATTNCDCRTNADDVSPCQVLNNQVAQVEGDLNADSVFFGVECDQVDNAPSCSPASSGSHSVEADMYSAQVTLVESDQPTVQGEGGGLWSSGPVWGTVPLTFAASDPSGIARVDVLDSTSDVDDVQESCTYAAIQACPELPSGGVDVNTLEIPDGQQQIALKLTDAAGNTTVAQGPTVVIDNNGPPAPSALTAAAASKTTNVINLAWSDPANPPEPTQDAYAQLCQSACGNPIAVSTSGGAQITAPAAGPYTVRLWLTDTAGRGSSANAATATVTVPASSTTTTVTTTTTTTTTKTTTTPCRPASKCPVFKVSSASWSTGRLTLVIAKLPKGDKLQITIYYQHAPKRTITSAKSRITIVTTRPTRLLLTALDGKRQQGKAITITKLTK